MTLSPSVEDGPLRPLESFAISLAFWGTLLFASVMYAVLSLAPALVEHIHLKQQHDQLVHLAENRSREVQHLERLAGAMERDPEFIARLARNELSLVPTGSTQFQVANKLGYDARIPEIGLPYQEVREAWYENILIKLSKTTDLRQKWLAVTCALFAFAFVCLNDTFFSGRLGRGILSLMSSFCQRYRLASPKID